MPMQYLVPIRHFQYRSHSVQLAKSEYNASKVVTTER